MSAADWRRVGPVSLSMEGRVSFHATLADAVRRIGRHRLDDLKRLGGDADPARGYDVGGGWRYGFRRADGMPCPVDPLHVGDESGLPVPLWRILEAATESGLETSAERDARWHRKRHGPYVFRRGPVGGIVRWPSGGSTLKRMRTLSERRAAWALVLDEDARDLGVRIRACRGADALPNSWDDEIVKAKPQRSWKRHRRTQRRYP